MICDLRLVFVTSRKYARARRFFPLFLTSFFSFFPFPLRDRVSQKNGMVFPDSFSARFFRPAPEESFSSRPDESRYLHFVTTQLKRK